MLFNVLMFINGYFGILIMLELVGGQASGNYSRPHPTSYLYLCMCVCAFVYIYVFVCCVFVYVFCICEFVFYVTEVALTLVPHGAGSTRLCLN